MEWLPARYSVSGKSYEPLRRSCGCTDWRSRYCMAAAQRGMADERALHRYQKTERQSASPPITRGLSKRSCACTRTVVGTPAVASPPPESA
jgi:hypothetical protein